MASTNGLGCGRSCQHMALGSLIQLLLKAGCGVRGHMHKDPNKSARRELVCIGLIMLGTGYEVDPSAHVR